VRHLVQDRVGALLVGRDRLAAAEDHLVAERHAARVLHRAHVVLGHEELVVLAERVAHLEGALEELEALLRHEDDVVGVEVRHERLPAEDAERDLAVLAGVGVAHLVVLAGDEGGDVGAHLLGGGEVPHGAALVEGLRLGRGGVRDDLPVRRRGHVERELRLEVGLLERGEHAAGVGHLELRVEVDAVVGRVHEAVQALARVRVQARAGDDELVLRLQAVDRDATVLVGGHIELTAVQRHGGQLAVDEVDEGRGAGLRGEPQRGDGAEALALERQVQSDVVGGVRDDGCALAGFFASEVGTGHAPTLPPAAHPVRTSPT